jgi:hypothetical protein
MQYADVICKIDLFDNVFVDIVTPEIERFYNMLFENYWGVDAIALYVQKLQLVGDTRQTVDFMQKLLRALYYANPVKDVYEKMISKFDVVLQELTTDDLDCFYTKLNDFIVNDLAKHLYF